MSACAFFVLDPVVISPNESHPMYVQVGDRLHLTCKATHNPAEFQWSRNRSSDHGCDKVEDISNESYGFHVDSGHGVPKSELVKNNFQWDDEGQYFCRRTNGLHSSGYSLQIAVVDSKSYFFKYRNTLCTSVYDRRMVLVS